jgi:hypothetical protein
MDHSNLSPKLVILTIYNVERKIGFATLVPAKGMHAFVVAWVVRRLEEMEACDIRLRTDPDPSVHAIAEKVKDARKQRTVVETTAIASHQALGGAERFHRTIQEQTRVLKSELELHLKKPLEPSEGFAAWLVRHASWLIFRYHHPRELGHSGFASVNGRSYRGTLVMFGEMVMARVPQDAVDARKTPKWQSRWVRGLWLGKTELSDEHLIFDGMKITRHRSIRRYSEHDGLRWDATLLQKLTLTPWNMTGRPAERNETRGPQRDQHDVMKQLRDVPITSDPVIRTRSARPSTPDCSACARRGLPAHGFHHSQECRRRYGEWLKQQLPRPAAQEPERVPQDERESELPVPTRRLRAKTSVTTTAAVTQADLQPTPVESEM